MSPEPTGLAEGPAQKTTDDQIIDLDDTGPVAGAADTGEVNPEEGKALEEPEPKGKDEDDDETTAEPKPKRASGSARLKEQNRQLHAELEAMRQFVPAPGEDGKFNLDALVESQIGPPPQEKDFPDYLDYRDERAAYLGEKRRVGRELRAWAHNASTAMAQEAQEIIDDFKQRAEEVSKRIPDLKQVLSAAQESPADPSVRRMLLASEKGPELAYYLSKNPNVVHSLNAMQSLEAARELGRLESRLSSIPPKPGTRAPEPIPALRGGASSRKSLDEMSVDEYDAHYQKKLKAKGG